MLNDPDLPYTMQHQILNYVTKYLLWILGADPNIKINILLNYLDIIESSDPFLNHLMFSTCV